MGPGFVNDLRLLVVDVGLEIEFLLVDQLDEVEWFLIQLFEYLLIRTLEELVILLT